MSGKTITITSEDGFQFSAYRAEPHGTPKGAIVVIQEIFGVNHHIRHVADGYASRGYLAIAPALFDRVEKNVELGYDDSGMQAGIGLMQKLDMEKAVLDVAATVKLAMEAKHVGLVGYCFGGRMAWQSAAKVPGLAAAVGYYGGGIAGALDLHPKIPVLLHFGEKDAHIPMTDVAKIREAHPEVTIYAYPADHGFNCDERGSYDKPSAALALERTLDFFTQHVG